MFNVRVFYPNHPERIGMMWDGEDQKDNDFACLALKIIYLFNLPTPRKGEHRIRYPANFVRSSERLVNKLDV
jgi:hypothetical protein